MNSLWVIPVCDADEGPVGGKRKANNYGLYDMHGNAGEWIENWYAKDAITNLYAEGKLTLPKVGRAN